MGKKFILALAIGTSIAFTANAQEVTESAPLMVEQAGEQPTIYLPANTEVLLRMNQEVTTKGQRWNEGDTFSLTVVHPVLLDGLVVIPRGSRGVGRITWLTDKGAFGKSGKLDIELEYVEVNGRRINVDGTYRQEGEGNTVATIGGVVVAGLLAGFITGKSGRIPQGRELMAYTESDLPLTVKKQPSERATTSQPAQAPLTGQRPAVVRIPG